MFTTFFPTSAADLINENSVFFQSIQSIFYKVNNESLVYHEMWLKKQCITKMCVQPKYMFMLTEYFGI